MCSVARSWTFVLVPIRTGALSPRITALNHTLACGPSSTSPTIQAPGATNAVGSMRGSRSRYAWLVTRAPRLAERQPVR